MGSTHPNGSALEKQTWGGGVKYVSLLKIRWIFWPNSTTMLEMASSIWFEIGMKRHGEITNLINWDHQKELSHKAQISSFHFGK